ncbi:MAG: carbohydrate ABC transporter permease [Fusobacteriaceae bacterium]
MNRKTKNRITDTLIYIFLGIAALFSIFPFYWLITGATNKSSEITTGKLVFGTELVNNFTKLISTTNILEAFFNTVKITLIYSVLALLITSLAAYGFDKFKTPGKEVLYKMLLVSMMIPFAALMIPLFRLMVKINLIDNYMAVIIPGLSSMFLIFFFRQSLKSFPNQIVEAARIDGASEIQIFFRIVIPPMKPTIAAAAIYAFMGQWNNYLWPLIVLQSPENKTLTLTVSSMSSAYFIDYGVLMLAIVIATLPIIIMFITMQKSFVEGMVGSSK